MPRDKSSSISTAGAVSKAVQCSPESCAPEIAATRRNGRRQSQNNANSDAAPITPSACSTHITPQYGDDACNAFGTPAPSQARSRCDERCFNHEEQVIAGCSVYVRPGTRLPQRRYNTVDSDSVRLNLRGHGVSGRRRKCIKSVADAACQSDDAGDLLTHDDGQEVRGSADTHENIARSRDDDLSSSETLDRPVESPAEIRRHAAPLFTVPIVKHDSQCQQSEYTKNANRRQRNAMETHADEATHRFPMLTNARIPSYGWKFANSREQQFMEYCSDAYISDDACCQTTDLSSRNFSDVESAPPNPACATARHSNQLCSTKRSPVYALQPRETCRHYGDVEMSIPAPPTKDEEQLQLGNTSDGASPEDSPAAITTDGQIETEGISVDNISPSHDDVDAVDYDSPINDAEGINAFSAASKSPANDRGSLSKKEKKELGDMLSEADVVYSMKPASIVAETITYQSVSTYQPSKQPGAASASRDNRHRSVYGNTPCGMSSTLYLSQRSSAKRIRKRTRCGCNDSKCSMTNDRSRRSRFHEVNHTGHILDSSYSAAVRDMVNRQIEHHRQMFLINNSNGNMRAGHDDSVYNMACDEAANATVRAGVRYHQPPGVERSRRYLLVDQVAPSFCPYVTLSTPWLSVPPLNLAQYVTCSVSSSSSSASSSQCDDDDCGHTECQRTRPARYIVEEDDDPIVCQPR